MTRLGGWRPGPAMLVTAAFIGPGTVTACTLAGAQYGYALLWTLAFATVATMILQAMAARVAIVTGQGLAEAILASDAARAVKLAAGGLVFAALAIGNAAYEGGNLAGAALGLGVVLGENAHRTGVSAALFGLAAGIVILIGSPGWLQRLLVGLVAFMSLAFIGMLMLVQPDWSALFAGFVPGIPDGALLTAIALIGTTIVPYNFFLHAARARDEAATSDTDTDTDKAEQVAVSQLDTIVSVALGGLVSMAILAGAASAVFASGSSIESVTDLAERMPGDIGPAAGIAVALGLIGAGFSSALTAPLATGYVLAEMLGGERKDLVFKGTALVIVLIGSLLSLLAITPTELILLAQSANGLLLPLIATFVVIVASRRTAMGTLAISAPLRAAGWVVVLVCFALGLRLVLRALGYWP